MRSIPSLLHPAGCMLASLAGLPAFAHQHTLVEPLAVQAQLPGHTSLAAARLWKLGCVAGAEELTEAEFLDVVAASRALEQSYSHVVPQQVTTTSQLGGFAITITVNSPPAGANTAIFAINNYMENFIGSSHATWDALVTVNFGPLNPTTAMSTSTLLFQAFYEPVRQNMVANMDPDDVIEAFLPVNTLPARFDSASATVTDCTTVWMTAATIMSTLTGIPPITDQHAVITVNSLIPWDYDPSDGITPGTVCFRSAFAHELGHALGFVSTVGNTLGGIAQQDLYRFQRTSGNPTSFATFTSMARLVDDAPEDDAELDFVNFEYAMSDNTPFTAEHFREQSPSLGAMDPLINFGETTFPQYFRTSDRRVLDALGYDIADPIQDGLARFSGCNRADENPTNSDVARFDLSFDRRVHNVQPSAITLAGIPGAAVTALEPQRGNAIEFSGLNWIDISNTQTPLFQSPFTIECWIRPTPQSTPAPRRQFLTVGTLASGTVGLYLDANNRVVAETNGPLPWNSPVINDGQWHHVALTSTGGVVPSLALYVDFVWCGNNGSGVSIGSGSSYIGRAQSDQSSPFGFIGAIDEVRIWRQFRGSVTIQVSAEVPQPSHPTLAGSFPLDELADFGYGGPTGLDTPERTLVGGYGEANWVAGGGQPVLVAGRVPDAKRWFVHVTTGSGSGVLQPTFHDNDTIVDMLSLAPLAGPGTSSTNGQPYTVQHASGFSYGFGQGCPCANDSAAGQNIGCLSSLGQGGKLRASGSPSISAGNLVLQGSQMPSATAIYLHGTAQQLAPLGDGLIALGGQLTRMRAKLNVSGASQYPEAGEASIADRIAAVAGQTGYFQVWYRNAATFCTSATFNETNAWRVTWTP